MKAKSRPGEDFTESNRRPEVARLPRSTLFCLAQNKPLHQGRDLLFFAFLCGRVGVCRSRWRGKTAMKIADACVGGGGHNNIENNPVFRGMASLGFLGRVFYTGKL